MSNDISTTSRKDLSKATLDNVLPLGRREIFWRAKYVAASGYLQHLPFLFWMVSDLQPHNIVTLGVGDGVAHFALCQAVERLGLDAFCYGLDEWHGEEERVPEDLDAYNARQYEEFSRLIPIEAGTEAELFENGSIDLLLVDRELSQALVEEIKTRWLPRLSESGVIILRGLDRLARDFGLREALASFCDDRHSLRIEHGGGLILIAAGTTTPPRVAQLLEVARDPALFRSIQQVFQRLGAGYAHEWKARSHDTELARLQQDLAREREAADTLREAQRALEEKLVTLNEAYDRRQEADSRLHSELADHRFEVERLEAEVASATHRAETAEAEVEALRATTERLKERAEADAAAHLEEVAVLTDLLAKQEQEALDAKARQTDEIASRDARHEAALQEAEAKRWQAEAEHDRAVAVIASRDIALGKLAEKLERTEAATAGLQDDLARRSEEIAKLTEMLDTAKGASPGEQARIAMLERRHAVELQLLRLSHEMAQHGPRDGTASVSRQAEALEASDLFDVAWYLERYPDVAEAGVDAIDHYIRVGAFEGRDPGPRFSTLDYYVANPDVAQAGWPALAHYALYGKAEGRATAPQTTA